jgi:putative ABC transport system substrate-binding protein
MCKGNPGAAINKRRQIILALGAGALTSPFGSFAQQPAKVPRIGLQSPFSPADTVLWHQAFRQGLGDLGWVEGKNISIEYVYADGKSDRLPVLTAGLVDLKVDIIVAAETNSALSAKNLTKTIPIVMASVGDPLASGLVSAWISTRARAAGTDSLVEINSAGQIARANDSAPVTGTAPITGMGLTACHTPLSRKSTSAKWLAPEWPTTPPRQYKRTSALRLEFPKNG